MEQRSRRRLWLESCKLKTKKKRKYYLENKTKTLTVCVLCILQGRGSLSGVTGPITGHYSRGYAYIDSGYPRRPGDRARLLSPSMDSTGGLLNQSITWNESKLEITIIFFHITDPDQPLCLRFWTHLFGNGIGTLKIIQLFGPPGSESSTRELWSLTGESSNNWHQGQISISSNSIFRVSIHCLQQFRIN